METSKAWDLEGRRHRPFRRIYAIGLWISPAFHGERHQLLDNLKCAVHQLAETYSFSEHFSRLVVVALLQQDLSQHHIELSEVSVPEKTLQNTSKWNSVKRTY